MSLAVARNTLNNSAVPEDSSTTTARAARAAGGCQATRRMCSGAGVSALRADGRHEKPHNFRKVGARIGAIQRPRRHRLTTAEVVTEIGKGAWGAVTGIGATFRAHPLIATATTVGVAAALSAFPILGSALLVFGLGSSAYEIGRGLFALRQGLRDHSKVEEDAALKEVGQGLFGVGVAALGSLMTARATASVAAGSASHATDVADAAGHVANAARSLNPAALLHVVDDLPSLFALGRHAPATTSPATTATPAQIS